MQSDIDQTVSSLENDRIKQAIDTVRSIVCNHDLKILGTGHESVVITDEKYIFKVFDENIEYYPILLKQLEGRFNGCKRLIEDLEYIQSKKKTILKYAFEPSEPYCGGRSDEIKEFLVESALCGITIKDVKSLNFRIFKNGLKFIDYGRDIVPFNYKDFIFMTQRAFILINEWKNPEFKSLVRRAITDWNMPELNGFRDFFNDVYQRLLSNKIGRTQYELLKIPENIWIENIIHTFFDNYASCTVIDNSDALKSCNITSNIISIEDAYDVELIGNSILITDNLDNKNDLIKKMRLKLGINDKFGLIFKNPFFVENNNSIRSYIELLEKSGFKINQVLESPAKPDENADFYSELIYFECVPFIPCGYDTSLVIKACYQDGEMLERLVRHIVTQLDRPDHFLEKIVVIDSKENDFLREYAISEKTKALGALDKLVEKRVIDRYYISPKDPSEICDINKRWFNINCYQTHSIRNIPVTPQLFAFEICNGSYILQADCDVIIVRRDENHSYLHDMKNALENNKNALSVSFNIAHSEDSAFIEYSSGEKSSYVPEVRICLIDKTRFFNERPYDNELENEKLKLSWYRSVESTQNRKELISLRGGDSRTFYIHPQNIIKTDKEFWLRSIERAESSAVPAIQFENVDLQGRIKDWIGPKQNSHFVFIICGRNLTNRKFLRGWQSIINQTRDDWSAVIINDNSENNLHEYIKIAIRPYAKKVTYLYNPQKKIILENIYNAVHCVCINPYSVIIIMDMDDMLLTNDILKALRDEYLIGADMVIGTALKTRKGILPFEPNFKEPRNERMGDVWIHLRSFRKYLFDMIKENDFKIDGEWLPKFSELTYTVPIAEMATHPVHIAWPLYLWEPGHIRNEEHYRLNRIMKDCVRNKPSYNSVEAIRIFDNYTLPPGEILNGLTESTITFIRHAEKEKTISVSNIDRMITERGREEARSWGSKLPVKIDLFITSTVQRTIETAECIKEGNRSNADIISLESINGIVVKDRKKWEELKSKSSWFDTTDAWAKGKVPESIIESHIFLILKILEDLWDNICINGSDTTLVITHDHVIWTIQKIFHNISAHRIYYLGGLTINKIDLYKKIIELKTFMNENHKKYDTSTDIIEIDITYRCDLKCYNCDRSCRQAPSDDDMSVEQIQGFIEQSEKQDHNWKRIRIMGGEPLLHPDIETILDIFHKYKIKHPDTEIEIFTNGISKEKEILIPAGIKIHSTFKTDMHNDKFEPYNLAPVDIFSNETNYTSGCWITSYCGLGLNKFGYYPCASGAAIDRVFGFDVGQRNIPNSSEKMNESRFMLCRFCGHYLNREYIAPKERISISGEIISESWKKAYSDYHCKKPNLTINGGRS